MKNIRILIVDDEKDHADVLAEALEKHFSGCQVAYDPQSAIDIIETGSIDILITDLNLNADTNGIDLLIRAKEKKSTCQVILITAYATIDTCKEAIRLGAYDYLSKPIDIDQLRSMTQQVAKNIRENRYQPQKEISKKNFVFDGVMGQSHAMQHVFAVLRRVAPTDITVLIEGESGTGKELLARAIHNNSNRAKKPFRPINCAGLTESLLESELFGHAKGAFTGAAEARKGLFEAADEGTLFLDEIGDMPLNMQAKLLRVLEDGVVTPVGSNRQVVVDVRVISATNHDLAKLVEQGKFRQDLYFRIKGVSVSVPALKSRPEDISELAYFFLMEVNEELGRDIETISEGVLEIFKSYDWPGNIRQLRNSIRIMAVMAEADRLEIKDIPPEIHQVRRLTTGSQDLGGVKLDDLEKQAIIDTLAKVDNNREKAAKMLGIGERTLYRKIKEYGIN